MAIGDPERATQNRMIAQLCGNTSGTVGGLGWRYLGDWQKREGNANIEPSLLRPWLLARGHVTGPRVHDARVAALCLAHGVTELWTVDRDFDLFPELATRVPWIDA